MKASIAATGSGAGFGSSAVPVGVDAVVSARRASLALFLSIAALAGLIAASVLSVVFNLIFSCGLFSTHCTRHMLQGTVIAVVSSLLVAAVGVVVGRFAAAARRHVDLAPEGHRRASTAKGISAVIVVVGAPAHFCFHMLALLSNP